MSKVGDIIVVCTKNGIIHPILTNQDIKIENPVTIKEISSIGGQTFYKLEENDMWFSSANFKPYHPVVEIKFEKGCPICGEIEVSNSTYLCGYSGSVINSTHEIMHTFCKYYKKEPVNILQSILKSLKVGVKKNDILYAKLI